MSAPVPEFDDLDTSVAHAVRENPALRLVMDDMRAAHELIDRMVRARRAFDLSQKDVAKRMDVKQPTVSEFETEASDPKLSTLQRYARALGGRLVIRFEAH